MGTTYYILGPGSRAETITRDDLNDTYIPLRTENSSGSQS